MHDTSIISLLLLLSSLFFKRTLSEDVPTFSKYDRMDQKNPAILFQHDIDVSVSAAGVKTPVPTPEWMDWAPWNRCSKSCGGGSRVRVRMCMPQGSDCGGKMAEMRDCNTHSCPNFLFTQWSQWGACDMETCTVERHRECVTSSEDVQCLGEVTENKACDTPCADPEWLDWSAWSICHSVGCHQCVRTRERNCDRNKECPGEAMETEACSECLSDWSGWSPWSPCSREEGSCHRHRERQSMCPADSARETQTDVCEPTECPTEWTQWSFCSHNDTLGCHKHRERFCGDAICDQDIAECPPSSCPTWSQWNEWTPCRATNTTSGDCHRHRFRDCVNGPGCVGESVHRTVCAAVECRQHEEWSPWSPCRREGLGCHRHRTQRCHPGVLACVDKDETEECGLHECPAEESALIEQREEWSDWSSCTFTQELGCHRHRSRGCLPDDAECSDNETEICDSCPTWLAWGPWTPCSEFDGECHRHRSRSCSTDNECEGSSDETEPCACASTATTWAQWSYWGPCSMATGKCEKHRSRSCLDGDCDGFDSETALCDQSECTVNGTFGDWADWSACKYTSRGCHRHRLRECTGGRCEGIAEETQLCPRTDCMELRWTEWSDWSSCRSDPGGCHKHRNRHCEHQPCEGTARDSIACDADECDASGWLDWSVWSECKSSGADQCHRHRSRACAWADGAGCSSGEAIASEDCELTECAELNPPVYSSWNAWEQCSPTCERKRMRSCFSGKCSEVDQLEAVYCSGGTCPRLAGSWEEWTQWSPCQCALWEQIGVKVRSRQCPDNLACDGGTSERSPCQCEDSIETTGISFIDVGYHGQWLSWGQCSCEATLTTGSRQRVRPCYGSTAACEGPLDESESCDCAFVSESSPLFGEWTSWSTCSATCGGGTRVRDRVCLSGPFCSVIDVEQSACSEHECFLTSTSYWSEWSSMHSCTATCGGGISVRTRQCIGFEGECPGPTVEQLDCNGQPCIEEKKPQTVSPEDVIGTVATGTVFWQNWSEWSVCECKTGRQYRNRVCANPRPPAKHIDPPCIGESNEFRDCSPTSCEPVNGGWTQWTEFSGCPKECSVAGKQSYRVRACSHPIPSNGGGDCIGPDIQRQRCNSRPCRTRAAQRIHGGFTEWSAWGECIGTCGFGKRSRTRSCTAPRPQLGGRYCRPPKFVDEQPCILPAQCDTAIVDPRLKRGQWSEWTSWSECNPPCGSLSAQTSFRTCTEPRPSLGFTCIGRARWEKPCFDVPTCADYLTKPEKTTDLWQPFA